jgi:hypothetical protein
MKPAAIALCISSLALVGCSSKSEVVTVEGVPLTPPVELPPNATPHEKLNPFAFMAGRWVAVTPNKLVNQEHWLPPRGNHMSALFTQVRRDGKPSFFEVSLISVDTEGKITLSLRHMHAGLEIPERRKDLSVFKFVSASDNRAEFKGTGASADVTSVVYRLTPEGQLSAEIGFAPTSKEKGFTTLYTRDTQ